MLFILRRRRKKNSINRNENIKDRNILEETTGDRKIESGTQSTTAFSIHMSKYIGRTVTVFVKGGGVSGLGFTGILMSAGSSFVRLLNRIGPPPACPLGDSCMVPAKKRCLYLNRILGMKAPVRAAGSVACIPVAKIASFVHDGV